MDIYKLSHKGFGLGQKIGGQTYTQKVLATATANLIAYWPLNEASGTTADNAEGTAARDGTYARDVSTMGTGTGIGDGNTAPLFNGDASGDGINVYSASLNTAYDQAEQSVMVWFKVSGAGVWTDGATRKLVTLHVDADNTYNSARSTTNNRIGLKYEHGATNEFPAWDSITSTNWQCLISTISETNDRCRVYGNGTEVASTTGIGTWAGNLSTTEAVIGVLNTGYASQIWDGYIAHVAIWTTELTAAQVTSLSSV